VNFCRGTMICWETKIACKLRVITFGFTTFILFWSSNKTNSSLVQKFVLTTLLKKNTVKIFLRWWLKLYTLCTCKHVLKGQ
jgi:hypothetical protein